jgi:hypothetical protein
MTNIKKFHFTVCYEESNFKLKSKLIYTPFCPHFDVTISAMRAVIYNKLSAISMPEVKNIW